MPAQLFNGISVAVDLEFIYRQWVVPRHRRGACDRGTDVQDERGPRLAAKDVKAGKVEANVLAVDRRIQSMRQNRLSLTPSSAAQRV